MSLSKILEEIKKVKQFADEDVTTGAIETLNARRGRKNQATERLKALREEYTQDLLRTACFILVSGEKRDAFTSTAVESFKCFSANPDAFYEDLANRVSPAVYQGKESVSNMFDVLGRHLEDKARELGVIGYPQLIFKQQYRRTITSKEDFVGLVKQAINEQVGGEMVGLQAVNSLTNAAIEKNHKANFTPIVLSTSDDKFVVEVIDALERLTPRVFLVVAGKGTKTLKSVAGAITVKDPTPESVEQALTTISSTIRK